MESAGRSVRWTLAVAGLALVACGSDGGGDESSSTTSGLAGMYQTTAHGESRPCAAAATALALEPPYLEVVDEDFGSEVAIDVYGCTGPDPSTCDEDFPLVFLAERVESGSFHTEETTKSGTATACSVDWIGYGVGKSGGGIAVSEDRRSGEWMGAICDGDISDEQVAMARELPCDVIETWSGQKL